MKQKSIAIAYPTIPIIFLGGIRSNRLPIYDTMGLAVTDLNENTRTETIVTVLEENPQNEPEIEFFIGSEKISGLRGEQIISTIKVFMNDVGEKCSLRINSNNYNIFSGSSDSGLAALFTSLNDLFEKNLTNEKLLRYSMKGSESAARSLLGGLTHIKIIDNHFSATQLASDEILKSIRLFSIPFHFDSRISADEIHKGIIKSANFKDRVKKIPQWVDKIKEALSEKNYIKMLQFAEENIQNAHELLESVGLVVRKPEIMSLCNDIISMREQGILGYYLIGGGNLVTIATTVEYAEKVAKYLESKKWQFYNYKVASAPKIR